MEGFIDIHTHILPGVDDGACDLAEAIQMIRMAWENGTGALVLTPHCRGEFGSNGVSKRHTVFLRLQEQVRAEFPQIRLYLGSEVRYGSDVPEKLAAGEIQTLNGSHYVLLEFGSACLRSQILRGISNCVLSGYTPVLAHAERYDVFYRDDALIEEVLDMGALIQVNAQSILGNLGLRTRFFCHKLLQRRQIHFVSSDCHDTIHRTPLLRKCWDKVRKKYGEEYAHQIFCWNAQAVIEDAEL